MTGSELLPGISIIIPSFIQPTDVAIDGRLRSDFRLHQVLRSIDQQSLAAHLAEVIVVANGDGVSLLDETSISEAHPTVHIRVLKSLQAGAGRARNIGIAVANRSLLTFVDDDDTLNREFLQVGLSSAGPDRVVVLPILDDDGSIKTAGNSLNVRIKGMESSTLPLNSTPWVLGFNSCKIIPTEVAKAFRYSEDIASGEDVVYFAHLLTLPSLLATFPTSKIEAAYVRTVRPNSVSRQNSSFEFSVQQRLQCVREIKALEVPKSNENALKSLINAQFSFVEKFLQSHPDRVQDAIDYAVSIGLAGVDWSALRREKADTLVFSYCFPPYSDTSANVVAKVIRNRGALVDVFYADMSRVRKKDLSTRLIVDQFLVHSEEINVEPSFGNWSLISAYAAKALRAAVKRTRSSGEYRKLYSRALWSGSHVAAALYKRKFPAVFWEAEFSDPLVLGADGTPREGAITHGPTTFKLKAMLRKSAWNSVSYATHFELTEIVSLACADRLIFTNSNQRDVMLSRYPSDLKDAAFAKSVIASHPQPSADLFTMGHSDYKLDSSKLNIGYFGNFYGNRGMDDLISAVAALPQEAREKLQIHVFTSKPADLEVQLWGTAAYDRIRANSYIPYLDFLALLKQFDVLLVNDVDVSRSTWASNPFLPSKIADYKGSAVPIWGIVSKGSPLSYEPLAFTSYVGDVKGAISVLQDLLAGRE